MTCPRCGSHSILRSHDSVGCFACGHMLSEPSREVWDAAWVSPGSGPHSGPPVTDEERQLWRQDRRR
ncbi:MAG: hypothetical protein ACKVT1_15305 [Dehalococcoidia bacterium]